MSADATQAPEAMRSDTLRLLIDTNVVLDLLFKHQPWFGEAAEFWSAWASGRITAYLLASILTDIYYIGRRQTDAMQAIAGVDRCLREFGILPVDRLILIAARALPGPDFEDNVQIASAQAAGLHYIVTRNATDYRQSPIPAVAPREVVAYLNP